jgi:hypothetical protein
MYTLQTVLLVYLWRILQWRGPWRILTISCPPLHQKRTLDKTKPERLVKPWMDSGASQNLGPLHEAQKHTKNQQEVDKEHVVTADANAAPLEVCTR